MKLSLAKKTHNGKQYIVPSDDYAQNELEKLKDGEYIVTITKARNPKHHNLVMKLIRTMKENEPREYSDEHYLTIVKLSAGYYDSVKSLMTDKPVPIAQSIRFETMDEIEFDVFHQKVADLAMKKYGFDGRMIMLIESFC